MERYIEITAIEVENGTPTALISVDLPDAPTKVKYYRLLNLVTDYEIVRATRLDRARENDGSWVTFPLGDRYVVGLFDKKKPDFWPHGLFLGQLHVCRILTKPDVTRLIAEGRDPLL